MMGHREKKRGGDEWDCFTNWRRIICCLQRSGVVKKTKRRFNKAHQTGSEDRMHQIRRTQ